MYLPFSLVAPFRYWKAALRSPWVSSAAETPQIITNKWFQCMEPTNMNNSTIGSTAFPYSVHELEGRIHLTSKSRSHFRFIKYSGLCTSLLHPQHSHPRLIKPNGLWFCFNMLSPEVQQERSKCSSCHAACAPLWLPGGWWSPAETWLGLITSQAAHAGIVKHDQQLPSPWAPL